MRQPVEYVDLDGIPISLAGLDADERRLVSRLRRRARTNSDWDAFENYWTRAVPAYCEAQGLSRKAIVGTPGCRIVQDLSSRLDAQDSNLV
jgi:hypothetical protein